MQSSASTGLGTAQDDDVRAARELRESRGRTLLAHAGRSVAPLGNPRWASCGACYDRHSVGQNARDAGSAD
ncbi:hypothetical protein [Streptomyces sp. NPDC021139]|uniref:hypothetical protein n=1 Tax=unclassified Streptomyces TaxID=2593676 RepID=UPI0007500E5B